MMKNFTIKTPNSFLLLSFIFVLSTVKLVGAADATVSPVFDTEGKALRMGTEYYILPVVRGRGGGLTIATTSTTTTSSCPLDVVQEQHEIASGLPLTFSPVNPDKGVVRISTDTNFKFSTAKTICVQSTVWRLGDYNEAVGKYFVTTGGVEGNPGRETTSNWFKIEKYDGDYKLVFCPTVCNFCKVICRDVGLYIDENGRRRLAVTLNGDVPVPFKVMFKKAA